MSIQVSLVAYPLILFLAKVKIDVADIQLVPLRVILAFMFQIKTFVEEKYIIRVL